MNLAIIHQIGAFIPEPLPVTSHGTVHAYALAMLAGRRTGQNLPSNIILARRVVRFLNLHAEELAA